jgi:hypothetical protein
MEDPEVNVKVLKLHQVILMGMTKRRKLKKGLFKQIRKIKGSYIYLWLYHICKRIHAPNGNAHVDPSEVHSNPETLPVKSVKCDARTWKRNMTRARKWNVPRAVVLDFYCRDDNTRASSGKKEYKTRKQIRYLTISIGILIEKFQAEFIGVNVSESSFYKLRPIIVMQPNALTASNACALSVRMFR